MAGEQQQAQGQPRFCADRVPALELRDFRIGPTMVAVTLRFEIRHILRRVALSKFNARLHRPTENRAQRFHHAVGRLWRRGFEVARATNMASLKHLVRLCAVSLKHVAEDQLAYMLSPRIEPFELRRLVVPLAKPSQAFGIDWWPRCPLRRDLSINRLAVLQQECVGARFFHEPNLRLAGLAEIDPHIAVAVGVLDHMFQADIAGAIRESKPRQMRHPKGLIRP
ncbi:hypothetical protein [Devosia faecipullorum]|uniref:hypothetical protein n=1 Tax=Devosia faecipullorum TaxID=2755039 RepID=UPI001E4F9E5E|nr:hypothetical protein [Devosia faecipullorum]